MTKSKLVPFTLAQIAKLIDGTIHGDGTHNITNIATLINASNSDISFLVNSKYTKFLSITKAGGVLIVPEMASQVLTNAILVKNPYVAYAKVAGFLYPKDDLNIGIHKSAWLSPNSICHDNISIGANVFIEDEVEIEEGVNIGHGCVIQHGSKIGYGTQLAANITICKYVSIGKNVIIHPGVVIGADGFGIADDNGQWIKVPQLGGVKIGDNVEIGANTTIDRGALDDTVISNGVKLDNQIQVGHNVIIGEHTAIAGCVGIAGSTHIGKHCIIGGGVGIGGHVTITDDVRLTGMTMVTKSITKAGSYSSGAPAEFTREWHKNIARYRKMGTMDKRLRRLETIREG
ncbi:MAG: UDP-3-O-(3-hydroxymyristoyl)glucosamine N-acyltransferase [Piscirickettsiaceae bacterium]|nr:UDP-3-O-(3-hydroxymyristoyl)glucosamine N-acyltransferase [Piscirickettsiaceae bacterium]